MRRLSRPSDKATTHKEPIYMIDGIIHYCVANMPGVVAKTSTLALTNAIKKIVLDMTIYSVYLIC